MIIPEKEPEKSEEWRTVLVAPKYEVSSTGRVRRAIGGDKGAVAGRICKATPDKDGYLIVTVRSNEKKSISLKVHRAVLFAFRGPPPTPKHECAHDDGDRTNNKPDNLFWKTSIENKQDKIRHGTHGRSLTEDQVHDIFFFRSRGETYQGIADLIGTSESAVNHVLNRRCWTHVNP